MFFDIDEVKDYIEKGDFAALDEVIEYLNEQVTERDSLYYLEFNYYSAAMEELFKQCMQARNLAMDAWLGSVLDHYIKDYDDQDFVALFFKNNPTPAQKIERYQSYLAQQKSPLVRFSDCTLTYDSHTAIHKDIVIPTNDTFSVLQELGSAATELHQMQFNRFNNFALATLRVVVRDKDSASHEYYQLIDIPIKDANHVFANLSDYAGDRDIESVSGRLRSSKIAKAIEARYQGGVALAQIKDHTFKEHKPSGQILVDAVEKADYEHEFHHSELALFQYLESDACILMLINYLKTNYLNKNDKVYAAILDIYSTQQYCQNCEISSLGLQAKHKDRFFAKFEKALLENDFRVPTKTRTKYGVMARGEFSWMKEKEAGIKTAVRCIANDEYFDKRRKKRPPSEMCSSMVKEKEFATPMRKNIKTETPISLIKIHRPVMTGEYKQASYSDVDKFTFFSSSKILDVNKTAFQDGLKAKLAGWG